MREFVAALLRILDDQGIRYAIGGSVASSYYGEPRTTQDVDLSLQLDEAGADRLVAACGGLGWYISPEEVQRTVRAGGSFSMNDGFWKADCFVVRDDPHALEALARRQLGQFGETDQLAWFLAPEDVIIHKLRWCGGKPLEKHLRDMVAILHTRYDTLDLELIARWVTFLETGNLWETVLDRYRHENATATKKGDRQSRKSNKKIK